jgi:hypothetical protein
MKRKRKEKIPMCFRTAVLQIRSGLGLDPDLTSQLRQDQIWMRTHPKKIYQSISLLLNSRFRIAFCTPKSMNHLVINQKNYFA